MFQAKLKTKLSGAEVAKLTKTYTANPAAYELYLKGKYYANRFTKEGLAQSIDCFNQAIAIDPTTAQLTVVWRIPTY